jgi:hypothetical protein
MALFDTNSGLGGLLGDFSDYGFGVPRNTGGLVADPERDAINKRALLSGLISAGLTYAATPKNLNTGSAIPYLGKAGLAGFNTSQDVVDRSLNMAYRNKLVAGRDDNIRTIKQDRFEITQEKQPDGSYKEIARSALDAPKEGKELEIERLISIRDRLREENPKNPNISIYDDVIKNARAPKEGFNINLGSPVAGTDAKGNPVFFQPSKTGGPPSIIQGVKPPEATANKLTEGERTAGFLSTRLSNSLKQLQAVTGQDPSAAAPNIGAEATKFFTRSDYFKNLVNPESRQQVEAAQYDILDSALTLGTGAAYTREQLESYRRSYFPQLGDKPKNIEDKAKRLQGVLDAAYTKAGRAATQEGSPAVQAKTVVRTGKDKSGKVVIEYSDGSLGYGN